MKPNHTQVPLDALPVPALLVRAGRVAGVSAPFEGLCAGKAVDGAPLSDVLASSPAGLLEVLTSDATAVASPDVTRGTLSFPAVLTGPALQTVPELPVMVHARPVSDGTWLVVLHDRRDELRLEGIVDAVADSTMLLTGDGLVKWQSGEVTSGAGHTAGAGTNPLERVHPEDLPRVLDSFVHAIGNPDEHLRITVRSRSIDDPDTWQRVEVSGSSELGTPGLEGLVVQTRNLDSGTFVESLGESEGEFHSLTDAAPIGIVVGDVFGRTVYLNQAALDLLGTDVSSSGSDWPSLASPEQQGELQAAIDAAVFEGRSSTATASFELGGDEHWLRVHVTPRFTRGRQTIGIITTLDDVTAEVEARAESERLKEMLDASSDYVVVFRPPAEVLYMNTALRSLVDRSGLRGKDVFDGLIEQGPRTAFIEEALSSTKPSSVWRGEADMRLAPDEVIPLSVLGVVRRNEEGELDWIAFLGRDISGLKQAEHDLREAATHDHLTGLPNRPLFNDRLEQAVERHKRSRDGVAVLFCDLDGFKEINDEHGHAAGDEVLATVAARIEAITRASDTAARVGGDEFVIVCEGVTDTDELAEIADRLIEAVGTPIEISTGMVVRIGISVGIGVARSKQVNVDPDRLLTLADTAMYRAKARGGSRFRIAALED